jgi:peptide-methionine (S)-S-oxide reductase
VRTRVGYAGGTKPNPTYYALGDHTETIQIDYDPAVISYETLLAVFWDSHDPAAPAWSRQYMSILFTHDGEQQRLAEASQAREAARSGKKILTEIRPAGAFYRAEEEHQKHLLRFEREIDGELRAFFPAFDDYVDSTAVARINGYLGGYGTAAELQQDLPGFGLSSGTAERLARLVARRPGRPGCPL